MIFQFTMNTFYTGNENMQFNHILETVSKILCLGLLIFQALIINKYLTLLYDEKWWCWIIADVSIIVLWIYCAIRVNKWVHRRMSNAQNNSSRSGNEIKFTYLLWFAYVTLLCPRVVVLFSHLVKTLDNADTFGPTFLKVAVACSPIIFFLLVHGSHISKSHEKTHEFKDMSAGYVALIGALDLFDSIDLLEFLFLPEEGIKFPGGYGDASLCFFCISFLRPVFSLYGLKFNSTSGRVTSLTFKVMGVVYSLILINIPNLVIRSILWHSYRINASVLIMKNVLGIIIGIYEFLEYISEYRPVKCHRCNSWVERSIHAQHKTKCVDTDGGVELSPKEGNDEVLLTADT